MTLLLSALTLFLLFAAIILGTSAWLTRDWQPPTWEKGRKCR